MAAVVLLALALIAHSMPLHGYEATGIDGAVDCDGPLSVLVFGLPSWVLSSVALALFPRAAWFKGWFGYLLPVTLLAGWALCAMSVAAAIQQQTSPDHREVCGAGL